MVISTCYFLTHAHFFFLPVITCPCVQMGGVYIVCVDNMTSQEQSRDKSLVC